ncbi:hypothetical protein CLOSCI_03037 [[Clostridium] scindens ATCC 35704]|nr:hypothetical protein CLOSCI_03037 [[Clostridium] scindens ATCC 35704]
MASWHFFYSLPRIWFVLNNRFRDYLGCLDLDIDLDLFSISMYAVFKVHMRCASRIEWRIRDSNS